MRTAFYWRLKPQFYRLQGFRSETGELSLQDRPTFTPIRKEPEKKAEVVKKEGSLYLKNAS